MRNVKRLGAIAVAVVIAVALAMPAVAKDATVGGFVTGLANAKGLNATSPQIAADSLANVGVRIPSGINFSKRLTEADVAQLSRLAGVNVTTTSPDRVFSDGQVSQFFQTFAGELGRGGKVGGEEADTRKVDFDPYSKGKGGSKGKKKGHRSPTDPE